MKPGPLTYVLDRSIIGGAIGFTKLGYMLRNDEPVGRLDGRTVVLTGATSGIGRAAAEQIAALGATLVMVARNELKAERAAREIQQSTGNGHISVELADLSLMSEVRDLANRLLDGHPEIHVLINNAGAMFNERAETDEGIELTLATNLLSGFLLTNLLLPRLIESAPSRVINVSSGGMYTQGVSLSNLQWEKGDYDGTKAYARTKRGQVILTEMWSDMLDGTGVTANAMHPGWADTPGLEASLPGFRKFVKPLLRDAGEGADTITWLAAAPSMTWKSGGFYLDRRPHVTNLIPGTDLSPQRRAELWDRLSELSDWDGLGPTD